MRVAFDFGGTLSNSTNHPVLRELARLMIKGGIEVFVISAVEEGAHNRARILNEIGELGLDFCGVHLVPRQIDGNGRATFETGRSKAFAMRQLAIDLLFDDEPEVCRAVRDEGLAALEVGPSKHVTEVK